SVSSADGAWSAASKATTTESVPALGLGHNLARVVPALAPQVIWRGWGLKRDLYVWVLLHPSVIRGGGEDKRDNGDDGGVDIASCLATSESNQAGTRTGVGIEILVVIRYAGCNGGVAADSSVSNGSVSSADGAWSAASKATTTESVPALGLNGKL
nr:hypothetical protein [Tanacetum cinerariifolium]